jgi:hypothetical protein
MYSDPTETLLSLWSSSSSGSIGNNDVGGSSGDGNNVVTVAAMAAGSTDSAPVPGGGSYRWACHLHKSANCEIEVANESDNYMYHIVPVKETRIYAQTTYNARTETDEFWERLPNGEWYTPYAYSSLINDYDTFKLLVRLFKDLDDNNLVYSHYNNPSDFVKNHIITDGKRKITLCNKHLLKCVGRKKSNKLKAINGDRRRGRYTSKPWIKGIVKSLFPKANTNKTIPTNVPSWAIDILKS